MLIISNKGGIMATKKPKASGKSTKAKSTTKPKTAAKTVEKPVSEAPITKTEETMDKTEKIEKSEKPTLLFFFCAEKFLKRQ